MFSAAQIFYDKREHDPTLDDLLEALRSLPALQARPWQWQGYSTVIPQILIEANVPFTLQLDDDPEYVPDEIEELAEDAEGELRTAELERLRRCNARIDVMSASPAPTIETGDAVFAFASTDLDPADPSVSRVIREVARQVNGLAFDCVNSAWVPVRA